MKYGQSYDVVFDAVTKSSFLACRPCLTKDGHYLATVPRVQDYLLRGGRSSSGGGDSHAGCPWEKSKTGMSLGAYRQQ